MHVQGTNVKNFTDIELNAKFKYNFDVNLNCSHFI